MSASYIIKFFGIFFCVVLITISLARGRGGKWLISPSSLFAIFFCIPYLINLLKLSDLQVDAWSHNTYLLILQGILIFGFLPIVLVVYTRIGVPFTIEDHKEKYNKPSGFYRRCVMVVVAFSMQLIINKIVSGYLFPAFYVENISDRFHTTEGVGFVATWGIAIWYVISFLCFADFIDSKDKKSFILFAIILIAPLTRLARFDVISVASACGIYWVLRNSINYKNILLGVLFVCMASLLGAFIAKYRWGGGDANAVSFTDSIGYNSFAGPFDVFAFLYAYYPLSFENIDRIVDPAKGDLPVLNGAIMFQPLTIGILKLHNIFPALDVSYIFDNIRDPIHGLATVPTALPIFALDFGLHMAWIPMLFYSGVGIFLFGQTGHSKFYARLYALYAIGYVHFPFLNHFVQPLTGVILILFFLVHRFNVLK